MQTGGFKAWKKSSASTTAKENHAAVAETKSNASRKAAVPLTFVRTVKNKLQGYRPIA
jgi:hypothetical protein